ncbi:MAG: acetate kinase, partial [Rhodocyclaceae bacterium]|nr:acetate kinase [Rhodocyclaceae bacterium]
AEAVDLFCYRIVREIGSLAAAIAAHDALVYTGGIGERAAAVRQKVCREMGWFGLELDPAANAADAVRISAAESRVATLVLPTNEEWMLARHTAELITPG